MLTDEILIWFEVESVWSYFRLFAVVLSQYTNVTDDRQTYNILWQKRNFAMRLQPSAIQYLTSTPFNCRIASPVVIPAFWAALPGITDFTQTGSSPLNTNPKLPSAPLGTDSSLQQYNTIKTCNAPYVIRTRGDDTWLGSIGNENKTSKTFTTLLHCIYTMYM